VLGIIVKSWGNKNNTWFFKIGEQKMGHERVGMLPKTRRWRQIVGDLSSAALSPSDAPVIASRTLESVRKQYKRVFYDTLLGYLIAVCSDNFATTAYPVMFIRI
jgi:hypothetical protein